MGASVALACNASLDERFCGEAGCGTTEADWRSLSPLANLPAPPGDPSNKYLGIQSVVVLGHQLFFDVRFAGPSLQTDALKRPVTYARAPKGQPAAVACVTCHDPNRAGVDTTSLPGNVSIGAAWADTNAPSTFNLGYYTFVFWNGRADSLWAQAAAACEGGLMNGNRLHTLWTLSEFYGPAWADAFPDHPLPALGKRAEVQALLETTGPTAGQCRKDPTCPINKGCREVRGDKDGAAGCWPRFPLDGKPGAPGCAPGDPSEPFGDAFDCMMAEDRVVVTRTLVNFGKAIAAYEHGLISGDAPFDRWINDVKAGRGDESREISATAKHGARLFVGKAACVDCHDTALFSDNSFHNVGVPQVGPGVPTEADCPAGGTCDCGVGKNCLPWGARDGLAKLKTNAFRRDSIWSDAPDDGLRKRLAEQVEGHSKGAWRTPSLRNVALTAPYMHNGALATLEDVVAHYNRGGSPAAPGARSAQIKPLFLTDDEQAALVEFLKTLTGTPPPAELTRTPGLP
jgi:cytochrome c peroxidase